ALAGAILQALAQPDLRNHAVKHNLRLVAERAELTIVMVRAQQFYSKLARQKL
ncbi:MAG: hypothetical protein IH859_10400, partial [Chloroflexi bacterium]|nr:hypothetical protein [Chloroflexota bacterium]